MTNSSSTKSSLPRRFAQSIRSLREAASGPPQLDTEVTDERGGEANAGQWETGWYAVSARAVATSTASTLDTAEQITPEPAARGASGFCAVLTVIGYPAEVYPGWLDPLLGYPGHLDVSLHIEPIDPATAAERLRKRQARLEAGRRHTAEHGGLPDPLVDAAATDAAELAGRIARGEAGLFRVGLYLAVHAATREALADEIAAVRALASSLLLDARPASYRQIAGWTACQPLGLDPVGVRRTMDTAPLAAAFPFTSNDLNPHPAADPVSNEPPDGVLYGFNLGSAGLVFYDQFAADNHNSVILGRSGSGKSYLSKLTLLRSLYRGVHAFVIDPEDEYTKLTTAVGGTVVRLGAPGVRLNPLELPVFHAPDGRRYAAPDALTRRSLFLHTFLTELLTAHTRAATPVAGSIMTLTPAVRALLDDAISRTYQRAGIHADQPVTWSRPAPTLADLADTLATDPEPAAATLALQLRPYTTGAFASLFTGPTTAPTHDPLRPGEETGVGQHLMSFSLRELPAELQAVGTLLVLDHIWRHVSDPHHRRPRLVVIDEAWMLMAQPDAARLLWRMAKSSRKHWAGLSFVTQDVADVLDSELGQAVITNSATQILLRQAPHTIDRVRQVFHLSAGEKSFLLGAGQGELLLSASEHRVAVRAVATSLEHEWITSNPAELAALHSDAEPDYIEIPTPAAEVGTGGQW